MLLTSLAFRYVTRFPNVGRCPWLEFPINFWAKNAKTTTIKIGNAALLKNLLIRWFRSFGPTTEDQE
jgi:hypothetical protein